MHDHSPAACRLRSWRLPVERARVIRIVDEGDVVDLGDWRFAILRWPGLSPGSIRVWECTSGTVFAGCCVYDGPLLNGLGSSNVDDCVKSMAGLRGWPIDTAQLDTARALGGKYCLG